MDGAFFCPMTCDHAIFYELRAGYPPRCAVCHPPGRQPYRIGLLKPDGTIVTSADLARQRATRNTEVNAADRIAEIREVFGGKWELVELECGPDGWPIDSKPMLTLPKRGGLLSRLEEI